jgi:NhaP-type Na+/H+ or K+/H+ antiporter
MAYESFHEAGVGFDTLADAAGWTVLLSVVLHGISAVPLANWYARRLETADPAAPELAAVAELDIRRRDPLSWLKQHWQEPQEGQA